MDFATILLADIGDWLRFLPLVVVAIWVISQVINAKEQQQERAAAQRRPQRNPRPPQQGAQRQREEIRVFLEQATGRRAGSGSPGSSGTSGSFGVSGSSRAGSSGVAGSRSPSSGVSRPARAARQFAPPARPSGSAGVSDEVEIVSEVEEISPRVSPHVDTSDFAVRASHLGEEVGLADEKLEARLHQTFDHAVGSLGAPLSERAALEESDQPQRRAPVDVERIRRVFENPANVRQAVIMSELLNRPAHRW